MEILLQPEGECSRGQVEETIRREVGQATKDQIEVSFRWVDDIPLTSGGKRRLVISDLARKLIKKDDEKDAYLGQGGTDGQGGAGGVSETPEDDGA